MKYESRILIENQCNECGRNFIPAPYHVYKKGNKIFCSYSCYDSFLREKERRAEQSKQSRKKEKEQAQ